MRLNQFIASCGVASRREADKIIQNGRVTVNGEKAITGMQVEDGDEVLVDGQKLEKKEKKIVLAYYKPVGVVCTEKDVHAKRTVIDDLGYKERVTYAGRLDKDSEGLLLLTNDGNLINAMMRGSKGHEKEYEVTVDKEISGDFLKKMASGVYLEDLDRTTKPCKITKTGKCSFKIILTQGLNRQIRRMCESLGYKVNGLMRTRVANINLGKLKVGTFRRITGDELKELYRIVGME